MPPTILMLTGDAGEAQEIYYAKYRLEEEGWRVEIAAPEKRPFLSVVHDFEPGFTPTPRSPATGSRPICDRRGPPGIVRRPGSARRPRTEYLRNRPKVQAIVRHFLEAANRSRRTATAALLLAAAGSLRGRTLTCYPELEPDVRAAGGLFVDREVVVDHDLVTVRAWPDNGPWMREFVRLVKSREKTT